jgi:predicted O-methyltransferase YrrM
VLLNKFRFIDEGSRQTAAYSDPRYIPFYYHLGKFIQPKTLLELGFNLGLFSGCLLKSCKSVEYFVGFQEKTPEYYSPRFGIKNVRDEYKNALDVYIGSIVDDEFAAKLKKGWDLVIVNEKLGYDKHLSYLETVWPHINLGGVVVMDYIASHDPAKEAFHNFCKISNRKPITFTTRYGTGIIQK